MMTSTPEVHIARERAESVELPWPSTMSRTDDRTLRFRRMVDAGTAL
jgi:hypothetical protein